MLSVSPTKCNIPPLYLVSEDNNLQNGMSNHKCYLMNLKDLTIVSNFPDFLVGYLKPLLACNVETQITPVTGGFDTSNIPTSTSATSTLKTTCLIYLSLCSL